MTDSNDSDDTSDDSDEVVSMYERDGKVGPGDAPAPSQDEEESSTEEDEDEPTAGDALTDAETTAPTVEAGGGELEEVSGTFYVKYAQDVSVTLHEVDTTQICTLSENPGFERHEIVEATLKEQPPMGVSYHVEELDAQYSIPVERSSESLTKHVHDIATNELDSGDAVAIEREGKGEIHILRVDPSQTTETAEELHDDEMTYKNAARYDDVTRVEIRTDDEEGVVSIRYMP
jgi:hypothetical protein